MSLPTSGSLIAASSTRPSKRLTMKPAAREAMLTYLPMRSELTRCAKSSFVKSTSSTREFIFAAR